VFLWKFHTLYGLYYEVNDNFDISVFKSKRQHRLWCLI